MTKLTLLGLAMMSVFVLSCTENKQTTTETKTEVKKEINDGKSKIEAFVSKKGKFLKSFDYNLPKISTQFCYCKAKIRLLVSESDSCYFFQILKKGDYSTKVESIAYEDVLEIIKAIESLKGSIPSDLNVDADYMENCFVTDDGLKVGYYISEGSAEWYVLLTGLNSDTLFFKNLKSLISVFVGAKERIESIKTANHKIA